MAPPVMFCVGATKAGTSWLHRYLSDHPDCHLKALKELHYFDALDWGEVDRQIADVEARRDRFVAEMEDAGPHRLANRVRQVAHCEEWLSVLRRGREDRDAYLGYLTNGSEGRLVGDMTPAYALLSEDRLRAMAAIAPDVRFLYLIRDPLDRLWSHVRMIAGWRQGGSGDITGRAAHILERVFKGKEREIEVRSDYRAALEKLGNAVDPRRLLVTVTEEMFTAAGIGRICAFLGIGDAPADFRRQVHLSPAAVLSDEQAARAANWLRHQYDYVADWLGRRPAKWRYDLAEA